MGPDQSHRRASLPYREKTPHIDMVRAHCRVARREFDTLHRALEEAVAGLVWIRNHPPRWLSDADTAAKSYRERVTADVEHSLAQVERILDGSPKTTRPGETNGNAKRDA